MKTQIRLLLLMLLIAVGCDDSSLSSAPKSIAKLLAICCIAVLLSGCEEPTPEAIIAQANARGKITDWQAERLSKVESLAKLAGGFH